MASRAIWAGSLKLGPATIPVKLYSAVKDQSVHFHILESKTKSRIKQHMVNPETGEEVPTAGIHKGYEVERGVFVLLDPKELASLEPKESRNIDITRLVPAGRVSHLWYDRSYYLGPNGNESDYFAFVQAMKDQDREGIAHWVMRKKSYVGAIRVSGDYLTLITLKHSDEVLPADELPAPHARGLSDKELKMAEDLVGALAGELDMTQFRDEYRDRVLSFIEQKAKGKRPRLHAVRAKRAGASLERDLAKSIAALKDNSRKEKKLA